MQIPIIFIKQNLKRIVNNNNTIVQSPSGQIHFSISCHNLAKSTSLLTSGADLIIAAVCSVITTVGVLVIASVGGSRSHAGAKTTRLGAVGLDVLGPAVALSK